MPSLRSNIIAFGLALVLFIAGVVAGIAIDRTWLRHHDSHGRHGRGWKHSPEKQLERFRRHLDLSDEQANEIEVILKRVRKEMEEIRAQGKPEMKAVHERAQREILEVLSPEQATEYEIMIKHARKHHERLWRHGP